MSDYGEYSARPGVEAGAGGAGQREYTLLSTLKSEIVSGEVSRLKNAASNNRILDIYYDGTHRLVEGPVEWDNVTASQWGEIASGSGTAYVLKDWHNMPASGTLRPWDISGGTEAGADVSFTVSGNNLTLGAARTLVPDDLVYVAGVSELVIGSTDDVRPKANAKIWFGTITEVVHPTPSPGNFTRANYIRGLTSGTVAEILTKVAPTNNVLLHARVVSGPGFQDSETINETTTGLAGGDTGNSSTVTSSSDHKGLVHTHSDLDLTSRARVTALEIESEIVTCHVPQVVNDVLMGLNISAFNQFSGGGYETDANEHLGGIRDAGGAHFNQGLKRGTIGSPTLAGGTDVANAPRTTPCEFVNGVPNNTGTVSIGLFGGIVDDTSHRASAELAATTPADYIKFRRLSWDVRPNGGAVLQVIKKTNIGTMKR